MRNTSSPIDVGTIYLHVMEPDKVRCEAANELVSVFRLGPVSMHFESSDDLRVFVENLYEKLGKHLEAESCTA